MLRLVQVTGKDYPATRPNWRKIASHRLTKKVKERMMATSPGYNPIAYTL